MFALVLIGPWSQVILTVIIQVVLINVTLAKFFLFTKAINLDGDKLGSCKKYSLVWNSDCSFCPYLVLDRLYTTENHGVFVTYMHK